MAPDVASSGPQRLLVRVLARVQSPSRCAETIISDDHRNIKFQFPLWGRTRMALSSTKSRISTKLRNSSWPMNGGRIRVESRFKGLRSASHPAVQFPKHATMANNLVSEDQLLPLCAYSRLGPSRRACSHKLIGHRLPVVIKVP